MTPKEAVVELVLFRDFIIQRADAQKRPISERENRMFDACGLAARAIEAVIEHHAQIADDRCRFDDDKLYEACGLPPVDRRVGDKAEMLKSCERFIDRRCNSGGWPTYSALRETLVDAVRAIDDLIVLGEQVSKDPLVRERALRDRAKALLKRGESC